MRGLIACTALAGLTLIGGCRICESNDDCAYPAYGGSWQRTNRNHGRVGSLFAPAGAKVAGSAVQTETTPVRPEAPQETLPREEDELERSLLDDLEEGMPDFRTPAPLGEIDQT